MPYKLTTTIEPEILRFLVEGVTSPDTVKSYLAEVLAEIKRTGAYRVMIVDNLHGQEIGIGAVTAIASNAIRQLLPHRHKVAYVELNPDHGDATKFGTLVAQNRGANIQFFRNPQDARAWLME